ncbi:MAG: class I SAM-dependent methyltransferase [Sumerlaeia bacterium]
MTEPVRRDYWDREITDWAKSSYDPERKGFLDKLRTSVDARKETALELIAAHCPRDSVLVDLGCGSGHFVVEALERGLCAKAYGVDFADQGIAFANDMAKAKGFADRAVFSVGNVLEYDIPAGATLVTGLGLMDWLHEEENRRLYHKLKDRRFIVSYSERDGTFAEIVHRVWLCERLRLFGKGVRAYHHDREFVLDLAKNVANAKNPQVVKRKAARFGALVHNLED